MTKNVTPTGFGYPGASKTSIQFISLPNTTPDEQRRRVRGQVYAFLTELARQVATRTNEAISGDRLMCEQMTP